MRSPRECAKNIYFEDQPFCIFEGVYEPAEDTFLLAENLNVSSRDTVLDMGTGCGILAVLSALRALAVVAVDISPRAVKCAKANGRAAKVGDRICVIRGDLFGPIREDETFDLILFNAPYLPVNEEERVDWIDYAWVGGEGGRTIIDRFISSTQRYLRVNGRILLVQSTLSGVDETLEKLNAQNLVSSVIAKKKVSFETITLIEAKKLR